MNMRVRRGHHSPIKMGLADAAIIFRDGDGIEAYIPVGTPGKEASEEARAAMLFGWLLRHPDILHELQQRQINEMGRIAEFRRKLADPNVTIGIESHSAIEALEPETTRILAAVKEICGIDSVLATNDTCLSDFRPREMPTWEYQARLSVALGMELNLKDPNDNYVVKLALRRRRFTHPGEMS